MKTLTYVFVLLCSLPAIAEGLYPLHSHNDYEQKQPLWDAYHSNFASVEADVWLTNKGELKVAHWPWQSKGLLEELYFKPLQNQLQTSRAPATVQNPVIIWIDVKDPRPTVLFRIASLLQRYPMVGNEVEVVLTGLKPLIRTFVKLYPKIRLSHDEDKVTEKNLRKSRVGWFTLDWKAHFSWKGKGKMPEAEYKRLVETVELIHAHDKRVRYYNTPDTLEYWSALKDAGVDLIDTNNPTQLSNFWQQSVIE